MIKLSLAIVGTAAILTSSLAGPGATWKAALLIVGKGSAAQMMLA